MHLGALMSIHTPWHSNPDWRPTEFKRFESGLKTSMATARIVTDAGPAYIKTIRGGESPHLLAIEFVATRLAKRFQLPVLDFALIEIDASIDEIPLSTGELALSGPAFVTRAIDAHTWGGAPEELNRLVNPQDIGRLVVFDTWVKNCDRFSASLKGFRANYDNVLLESLGGDEAGKLRLVAMDHTHCFTCGRQLDAKLNHIASVRYDQLFGLFPGFIPHVRQDNVETAVADLGKLDVSFVAEVVEDIPAEWQVSAGERQSLKELIVRRADYVAQTVLDLVKARCWPEKLFDA